MRMNQEREDGSCGRVETAADLVNRLGESSLSRMFQEYGDVPMKEANRVARLICVAR